MGSDTTNDGISTAVDSDHALENGTVNKNEGNFFQHYAKHNYEYFVCVLFVLPDWSGPSISCVNAWKVNTKINENLQSSLVISHVIMCACVRACAHVCV